MCSLLSLDLVFFLSVQEHTHFLEKKQHSEVQLHSFWKEGILFVTVNHTAPPSEKSVQALRAAVTTLENDNSLLHPRLLRDKLMTFLHQQVMSGCSSTYLVLYHGAEGGAVRRHGGGDVAICWGVRPHQQGAAVYGVLPLLRARCRVCHGNRSVGNIALKLGSHGVHLARHHGNPTVS